MLHLGGCRSAYLSGRMALNILISVEGSGCSLLG